MIPARILTPLYDLLLDVALRGYIDWSEAALPLVLRKDGQGGYFVREEPVQSTSEYIPPDTDNSLGLPLWRYLFEQQHRRTVRRGRLFGEPVEDGIYISAEVVRDLLGDMFISAISGHWVVSGLSPPLTTDSLPVAFPPLHAMYLWHFDLVKGTGAPRDGHPGVTYFGIRVYTSEEWAVVTKPNNPIAAVTAPQTAATLPLPPASTTFALPVDEPPTSPLQEVPTGSGRRPVRGVNYDKEDQPLITEMRRMLTADPRAARGPYDAALALSAKAVGTGGPQSKAKRLVKRYSAVFGAIQSRSALNTTEED